MNLRAIPTTFLLTTLIAASAIEAKATTLLAEYDLSVVVAHAEFTTPVLSVGSDYYFVVTGRYGVGPLDRGDSMSDAAFAAYRGPDGNWGPLDVWHYAISGFKFDGVANPRPSPDVYRTDHVYTYLLTANNQPLTVSFDDTPVWDNVGGPLHFQLYQTSSVPETGVTLFMLAVGLLALAGFARTTERRGISF